MIVLSISIVISSGIISAFMSFALTMGIWEFVLLSYFIPFPLFFIGLSQGFQACLAAVAVSLFTLLLLGGESSMSIFLLLYGLPSIILVYQTLLYKETDHERIWATEGYLFAILTVLGLAGLACGWLMTLQTGFQSTVTLWLDEIKSVFSDIESIQSLEASFIPGILIVSWMLQYLVNGIFVQIALVRIGNPIRPRLKLRNIELPRWMMVLFIVSSILGVIFGGDVGFLARNIAFISAIGFFFTGLSVFHSVVESFSYRTLCLIVFYLCLFLSSWVIGLMVILGLAEHWLQLRKQLTQAHTHIIRRAE